MYFTVELVLKSYMPRHLEPGMWFITKLNPGTRKEYTEIWALDKTPLEPLEEFITKNGAPVEPYLIYDEQVLAEPEQIGWWDEGPDYEELRDIELKDFNLILSDFDGEIDIDVDPSTITSEDGVEDEDEIVIPIIYEGKCTLRIPMEEEYEEDYDDYEDWDDMDDLTDDDGPETDSAGFSENERCINYNPDDYETE